MADNATSFNSAYISKDILIDASQGRVRQVLLDFERLPQWKNKMIYTIDIYRKGTGEKVRGIEAEAGDILSLTGVSGAADAEVVENTPTTFKWKGGKYCFKACHWIEILASPESEQKTLIKHCEREGSVGSFMLWSYSPLRGWLDGLFVGFCEDLKKQVEARQ